MYLKIQLLHLKHLHLSGNQLREGRQKLKIKKGLNLQIKTVFLYVLPKECLANVLLSHTSFSK